MKTEGAVHRAIPNPLYRCSEGEEALGFFAGLDGRQVLEHLEGDAHLKSTPVIVFWTSDNPKDVRSAYAHGASGYLLKPVDLPRFERMIQLFKDFWLDHLVLSPGDGREGTRR